MPTVIKTKPNTALTLDDHCRLDAILRATKDKIIAEFVGEFAKTSWPNRCLNKTITALTRLRDNLERLCLRQHHVSPYRASDNAVADATVEGLKRDVGSVIEAKAHEDIVALYYAAEDELRFLLGAVASASNEEYMRERRRWR